ncbi:MAG: polysaccharide deacetylase family protein [Gemmatimonadetes bacterium]|nr:polysaccharide deacetylase family protein [Gemmatimonadota bacterium]
MKLLVSIHDVTPALMPGVERLWTLCRAHGVTPALLVVPDWHGAWPVAQHPEFLAWVRARAAEGAEIILHGERHDEVGSPRAFADTVRAFGRTNAEGEFLTLGRDAAAARIGRGLATLKGAGLDPVGFIPPAWLMRADTIAACAAAGLAFTEDDGAVYLTRAGGRRIASPVVRWSGRTPVRAWVSAAIAAWRFQVQRDLPLVRIAFHPSDLDHPATAASAARELARWVNAGAVVGYGSLVDPLARAA